MTGRELLELRKQYGVSQVQVADVSEIASNYLSLLESDERIAEYRERAATAIRSMGPRKPAKRGRSRRVTLTQAA